MKKTTLYILGAMLLLPMTAASAFGLSLNDFRDEVFRPENLPGSETGSISAETRVTNIIDFLVNLILYASGSVAVLMLVYGGIRLITGLGNTEQKESAVKIIKYSGFGLAVVILAYALVTNLIDLIFRATT